MNGFTEEQLAGKLLTFMQQNIGDLQKHYNDATPGEKIRLMEKIMTLLLTRNK